MYSVSYDDVAGKEWIGQMIKSIFKKFWLTWKSLLLDVIVAPMEHFSVLISIIFADLFSDLWAQSWISMPNLKLTRLQFLRYKDSLFSKDSPFPIDVVSIGRRKKFILLHKVATRCHSGMYQNLVLVLSLTLLM